MKKEKYYISFENLEHSMCSEIEISKSEYQTQLDFMRKQVKKTSESEAPVIELESKKYESETTIKTVHFFNCGCSYTDLSKIECKDGYRFLTKKEAAKL